MAYVCMYVTVFSRNNSSRSQWDRGESNVRHFDPNPGVLLSDNDCKTQQDSLITEEDPWIGVKLER